MDTDGHAARQIARHSDRFRDQILHGECDPDEKWDPADYERFLSLLHTPCVQDVQAPSAQAVTGGHGECECGDCMGFTAAWETWAAERRGAAA